MSNNIKQGTLYVISAASGAGKTSLIKALLKQASQVQVAVSYTTRAARMGEINGTDYHFVSQQQFQAMIDRADFFEYAEVFGNLYGSSQQQVQQQLNQGYDVILEIDWQGARQIRRLMPTCRSIYIAPPSLNALKERLTNRKQDDEAIITKRMKQAQDDISHFVEFDYLIINNNFDEALIDLTAIIKSESLLLKNQPPKNTRLITELLKKF